MEKLKDLKALVELLKNAENDEERIEFLQEMGAKLINDYEIVIDDLTIEPLLVEAYYYDEEKFPDISVHSANPSKTDTYKLARERQIGKSKSDEIKSKIGELYVHYGTNDGIDIVLSDGNYALSFLIKNALVYDKSQIKNDDEKFESDNFKTQVQISDKICKKNDKVNHCDYANQCNNGFKCKYYDKIVLHKKDKTKNIDIIYLPRKGVSGNYVCAHTAALALAIDNGITNYDFTTPNGYKKQWRHATYALIDNYKNEERAFEAAKKSYHSTIEIRYQLLAKHTLYKALSEKTVNQILENHKNNKAKKD